ncbi:alkaline phosphatase family protein [Nocardioides sp. CER19]|uniref:alkaline phosphatase family protein n=1 Tax=Nocardioides sp. CER19 TaxID=3038538 RepID=UPI00244D5127|nr:alkaline phosphatase family protein [Nocardioides sp. CER19]MDH2414574.1 alkaline phosphatase family protein [Nocardioides sp. CER19]
MGRQPPSALRTLGARDLAAALLGVLGATLGLLLAAWLAPGTQVQSAWQVVVGGLLVSVGGLVLRLVLTPLAVRLGWAGAVLLGLGGQWLAIWLVLYPSADTGWAEFWWSVLAAWLVAAVSTVLVWLFTAGTDDAVTASLLRRARRSSVTVPDPDVPGVVFVQADGVPFPVLDVGIRAGTMPTVSRWLRGGTHRMAEWRPMLPATTPASQMGILHGTIDGIPAFRWVDRASQRVLVANRPRDAAEIEAQHSDGHGLLADDGVSISNLFTGDAPTAVATMSAVERSRETRQAREAISDFLGRPAGFARSFNRTLSEVVRERYQATRARRRDVRPRIRRGWSFAGERAALVGVLRDLNTTLVTDAMLRGNRSIYVDYVDYDAVAHHAGLLQPESLSALEGIDAVLAQLEKVAAVAPRRYRLVVLSDHGQSQGEIFADRYGEDLATLVSRLAEAPALDAVRNAESSGSLNSMVASAGGGDTVMGRALNRVSDHLTDETSVGDGDRSVEQPATSDVAPERFMVFGSGNLGLVYVSGESHRLTLEELAARFPGLVPGLADHPGIGFVVGRSAEHGPVVLGADGEHRLRDGLVVGKDPLAPFGPHAAAFIRRVDAMPEAPDLYVNSLIDELGEVAAFEDLVGCHGGLGGWQDRAMVVHPVDLPLPDEMVVGAHELHRVFVGWLDKLGHRTNLTAKLPG